MDEIRQMMIREWEEQGILETILDGLEVSEIEL